jgi:hypothetical protein
MLESPLQMRKKCKAHGHTSEGCKLFVDHLGFFVMLVGYNGNIIIKDEYVNPFCKQNDQ